MEHNQSTSVTCSELRKPEGFALSIELVKLAGHPVFPAKCVCTENHWMKGCKTIWVGWVDKKPEEEDSFVFSMASRTMI